MFGSTIVTVFDVLTVEKFGAKSDVRVCGVMFCNEPDVMTSSAVVVPTSKWLIELRSAHACMSRGMPDRDKL